MNSLQLTRHLHSQGYLSKEAAVRVLRKRDDLIKQAMRQWAESYFGIEKTAAGTRSPVQFTPSVKGLPGLLGLAGLVALGTTAAKVGLNALGDLKMKGQLNESYRQMFSEFPELKEDKGQARKFFSMMAQYAPALASNPVIAGTWVKATSDKNIVDPRDIQQLIESQQKWEDIRTMKSPILGFSQEMPRAGDIFEKSLIMGG